MAKPITSTEGQFGQRDSQLSGHNLSQDGSPSSGLSELVQLAAGQTSKKGASLRLRLLQTILPVVLIPLMLAGAAGYRVVQQRTEERVQEQLENQALLTSEGTTEVLKDLLDLPRSIAANPLVINEAVAGSKQVESEGLDQVPPQVLEERFAATKLLRTHNRLNAYLKETTETAEISEISVTDSHGFNVAYSAPTTDFVQSDEPWWQNGKEQGLWIGAPDFNYAAKGFTIELAQAIKDPSTGSFVGVVRTVLPARKFSLLAQYLKRTGISNSQRVQLVDASELKVIDTFSPQGFRKSREVIGGKPIEQVATALVKAAQKENEPQQILQNLQANSSVKNLSVIFSDKTTTAVSFTDGDRQYKIASIPQTQWVAIASMDKADISAAGRDSLIFIALTTLLLAGITTALILWLARQLSAPLDSLAVQAQQVAAGDFDVTVPPSGTTETRTLTQTFNQLVVRVKDLLQRQESETQKAQLFAEVTGASATSLFDLKPIFDNTLPHAQRILNADRILFYPIDSEQFEQLASEAVAPEFPTALTYATPVDCIPTRLRNRESDLVAVIDNVATAKLDPAHRTYLSNLNAQATLTVPVFNEESLFGFLIAHHRTPHEWQPSETNFMTQLAAQFKLVIDRVTALTKMQESQQFAYVLNFEKQQQSVELSQHKEQLSQQSEDYRRQQEHLQQQVSDLINDIQGVFQGDLTVRAQVTEGDLKTVADVFNLTVAKLQELVKQIKQSTFQVNSFLSQNEEMVEQLANATQCQTQEATLTLSTVQTMIQSMNAIADNARQAAVTANSVATTAEASETAMNITTERIFRLDGVCTSAVRQMQNLGGSTQHIAKVASLIRETAAEIGVLSMQVNRQLAHGNDRHQLEDVAKEIGRLAERTVSETTLIDSFLETLQAKTTQIAEMIKDISSQVAESTELVQDSKQSLEDVATVSRQFNQLAQSISTATTSQSQISQSVANLVQEVAGLSDQTTSFSQKMEQALKETIETAQQLQDSVSLFKV